jgi:hypothetical protein
VVPERVDELAFVHFERPSIPSSLARSCSSSFDQSSQLDDLPPRLPAVERRVLAILAAFSSTLLPVVSIGKPSASSERRSVSSRRGT